MYLGIYGFFFSFCDEVNHNIFANRNTESGFFFWSTTKSIREIDYGFYFNGFKCLFILSFGQTTIE